MNDGLSDVYLVYAPNAVLGGKRLIDEGKTYLIDGVQFHHVPDPRTGAVGAVATNLGTIELPEGLVSVKLSKESPYFKSYTLAVSNIKLT